MRTIVNFNYKWAFTKQCTEVPAALPMDWNWVNLPHCWNAIDGQDGGNDYYRGTCYYAKSFDKIDLPQTEEYYLEFQGANASADVYLNGKHLAHHDGGYSTWRVNITEAMLARDNLLVVTVDNSVNEVVYPQTADFTFYGGIYRDVNLICVGKSHFDLDYYGGPGLAVTPPRSPARMPRSLWKPGSPARLTLRPCATPCATPRATSLPLPRPLTPRWS